jgi:hypothetical protein
MDKMLSDQIEEIMLDFGRYFTDDPQKYEKNPNLVLVENIELIKEAIRSDIENGERKK